MARLRFKPVAASLQIEPVVAAGPEKLQFAVGAAALIGLLPLGGDGLSADVVLDVEEDGPSTGSGTFSIYPNPSNGDITIELRQTSQVSVFNAMGQQMIILNEVNGLQRLHLDATGVYFVRISNTNGVEVKKIIVE